MVTANKYSKFKIAWFNQKLEALRSGQVTAPVCVRLKPTNRCLHNCFFCVYREGAAGMHGAMARRDEIPLRKLVGVFDDFASMGVRSTILSGGGEPLMHPDIVSVVSAISERKIDFAVLTNATLLSGRVAEALSSRAKWVRVSVDYYDRASFTASRGVDKFDQTIRNIKEFSESGGSCELTVNFIVHSKNYEHVEQAAGVLFGCGVKNIRFSPVWVGDFYSYHAPLAGKVSAALDRIREGLVGEESVNSSYTITAPENSLERGYTKCYFCQVVPTIGADQTIYACHNKAYDKLGAVASFAGDNESFKAAWNSDQAAKFFSGFNPSESCRHQCANHGKNVVIGELVNSYGDSFV